MSCYSASIHLWMNEMLTVGLQPFKLWMNCFSGMVGFFALCYVELLWWSNVKQSVPMEHIAIFTCYADMQLTSVYSGKGFVFIRTFSFFPAAAAAAPAWTIVLGYCNHSFNLVYLFSRYTFVVVAQKSAAASSTSSPSRGHLSLSLCCCKSSIFYRGEMMLLSVIVLPGNVHHVGVGCSPATHYHFCNSTGMSDDDWVENCIYHQVQRWYGSIVLGIIIRFGKIFLTQFLFLLVHFFVVIPSVFPSVRLSVCPSICPIVIYTYILKCWFNFSKRIMMVLFYLFIHIACEIFV